jgi:cytochrome c2
MDSFELNKIAGAVLFALLVAFGLSIFSGIIFETEAPAVPGFEIAVAAEGGEAGGEEEQPIAVLLASADAAAGESAARQCASCHTFQEGEANGTGPNLWSIVNRPIASVADFEYSPAMQEFAAQAETWTFEHLNTFVHDPQGTVPGTIMTYTGMRNDQQRASLLLYLNTLSAEPAPLPEPPAEGEAAAEGEVPAEGEAAAEGEAPAEEAAPAEGTEQPAEGEAAPAEDTTAAEAEAPAEAAEAPAEGTEETPATDEPAAPEEPAGEQSSQAEGPAAPDAAGESGFAAMVAAADPAAGEGVFRRCFSCHSAEPDGGSPVGPNLFGVVNRPIASLPDFEYSPAMIEFSEGGSKTWTPDNLNVYLTDPQEVVPDTLMVFPGIPREEDRASLIAYLSTLTE